MDLIIPSKPPCKNLQDSFFTQTNSNCVSDFLHPEHIFSQGTPLCIQQAEFYTQHHIKHAFYIKHYMRASTSM